MARAPVSKTGGWGFESLHSCQAEPALTMVGRNLSKRGSRDYIGIVD
jgi:hypothetical protein